MNRPVFILRENLPSVYYLIIGIINGIRRLSSPYSIYITDSLGGSFKNYLNITEINQRIADLKRNLDDESVKTVDAIIMRIRYYPDERNKTKITEGDEIAGGLLPVETQEIKSEIEKELREIRKKFKFISRHVEESVFYYFHGIRLLPQAILKYLEGEDFVDLGAFTGDSAIALHRFNYKKIFSVEMSQKSIIRFKNNLAHCNITNYEIINACIGAQDNAGIRFYDTGSAGLSILRRKGKYDEIHVKQVTLDTMVDQYKISPRFIKVDIEGNSLAFVKGAIKTLKNHRPVLSVAIYHNPQEFFEVKPLIEEILPDYVFLIRKLSSGVKNNLCHSEVILLAYPKEILD